MVESVLPQVPLVRVGFLANRVGMGYAGAVPDPCPCIELYTSDCHRDGAGYVVTTRSSFLTPDQR